MSLISCILLQMPLLKIIKKIGNTNLIKLGSLLLLISSILLTFGLNYIVLVLGKVLYEIAFTFQNMANAILKNNLELQGRDEEYIKVKTKSNTIYATATMIIAFISSPMFNINNYLSMFSCILFCIICFVLSFSIIDFSNYDKIKTEEIKMIILFILSIIEIIISIKLYKLVVNLKVVEE